MNGDPCGAGRTRSRARHGCAYAAGSRAPALGAGCSAGRSACPWPRLSLLVVSAVAVRCTRLRVHTGRSRQPLVSSGLARNRRGPENPVAAVSPTFGRLFEGTDVTSPGQTALSCRPSPQDPGSVADDQGTAVTAVTGTARVVIPNVDRNVAERLAAARKTVSFCQCRFSTRAARRQLSEDARPATVQYDTESLGLTASPSSCADMLRDEDDCPVHTCG